MAQRRFIVLGDTTNHGGRVVTASSHMTIDGKQVACVGDKVTCPRCKGLHVILGIGKNTTLDGKEMACEGDPVSDGSYLMSIGQANATHEVGAGPVKVSKPSIVQTPSLAPSLTEPESAFCLECWLKAQAQRNVVMPL
jgi:uncharacterized Zn-binding protein involved in type VI secretion